MSLVEWLNARKTELGFTTDRELARYLGISESALSLVMTGKRAPSEFFQNRVLKTFRSRCSEILDLDELRVA